MSILQELQEHIPNNINIHELKTIEEMNVPWYMSSIMKYQHETLFNDFSYTKIPYPALIYDKIKHIQNEIDIKISNINCKSKSEFLPDLQKHNFATYGNCIQRGLPTSTYKLIQPKSTTTKSSNGVTTCVGTTDKIKALSSLIRTNHSVWRKTQTPPWISDFSIKTIVSVITLPYNINLQKLSNFDPHIFKYDKETYIGQNKIPFPGISFRSYKLKLFSELSSDVIIDLFQEYNIWHINNKNKKHYANDNNNNNNNNDDEENNNNNNNNIESLIINYEKLCSIANRYTDHSNNIILLIKNDVESIRSYLIEYWRYSKSKKVSRIFQTGKITITGTKTHEETLEELLMVEKYTNRCKIYVYNTNTINLNMLYDKLINYNKKKYKFNNIEFRCKNSKKKTKEIDQKRQQLHKALLESISKLTKLIKTTKSSILKLYNNKKVYLKSSIDDDDDSEGDGNQYEFKIDDKITVRYGVNPEIDILLNNVIDKYKYILQEQNNILQLQQNDICLEFTININDELNNHDSDSNDQDDILPTTDIITFNCYYNNKIEILDADTLLQSNKAYSILYNKFISDDDDNDNNNFILQFNMIDVIYIFNNNNNNNSNTNIINYWVKQMNIKWKVLHPLIYQNNITSFPSINKKRKHI